MPCNQDYCEEAEMLKALGHPVRWEIIRHLHQHENRCCGDLCCLVVGPARPLLGWLFSWADDPRGRGAVLAHQRASNRLELGDLFGTL